VAGGYRKRKTRAQEKEEDEEEVAELPADVLSAVAAQQECVPMREEWREARV